jgi:hypothetical protein
LLEWAAAAQIHMLSVKSVIGIPKCWWQLPARRFRSTCVRIAPDSLYDPSWQSSASFLKPLLRFVAAKLASGLAMKISAVAGLAVQHGSGVPGGDGVTRQRRFVILAALCGTVVLAGWVVAGLAGVGSPGSETTDEAPIEDRRATSLTADAEPVNARQATAIDKAAVSGTTETLDECLAAENCIDQYLWSVYQRTPKVDTIKVQERRKVTVKQKGKTRTVIKELTKLVDEDFTWKDPKAAEKTGMSLMEYVIGGMDRSFKLKLYHALRALDEAGLAPGITSAFRDDYRQSLASGLKAATDRSYHGGSFRGGYGHGLAADVVSVKGETRAERCSSSENLWKWIDAHGKEFGIGRPYLDKDPAHVAPIDGKEYADHYHGAKAQHAGSETKKRNGLAARDDQSMAKRARTARSSKATQTQ